MDRHELSILGRMGDLGATEWDALLEDRDRPLLSHGFLSLLEESGSATAATGWTPAHLLLREKTGDGRPGRLLAAAPFYLREDSWGDFVFDQEFAAVAEEAGLPWYPKLVGAVPFTPAPAWRVLTAPGTDRKALTRVLLEAALATARASGLAGLHLNWPAADLDPPPGRGWAAWPHQVFLWTDVGYGDFPGWLASLSKNMRRNILRERASLAAAKVESRILGPAEAAAVPGLLERFAHLYRSHHDKFGPWAARFLEPDFFRRLPEFLPEGWALSCGFRGDDLLGAAFLLEGPERLYGRYYGVAEEVPGLHFELCYYAPLAYALAKGIPTFDPGMGSPHKARRGFASHLAPSYHLPFAPPLQALLSRVMPDIAEAEAAQVAALNEDLPYKKTGTPGSD